jgi:hypothetical protein
MDYNNDIKTARMTVTLNAIDAGAGPGYLEIYTAGYAEVLLTYVFEDPCGAVSGDPAALIFAGMPKQANASAGGLAALALIKDSDGVIVAAGLTVGTAGSGKNVEISSTTISSGQAVNLLSGALVHG